MSSTTTTKVKKAQVNPRSRDYRAELVRKRAVMMTSTTVIMTSRVTGTLERYQ